MRACAARKRCRTLIWGEIEKVNADFARVETIKRFYLIEQQLTPEDDELTPTMKLKRKFVNEKYQKRSRPCIAAPRPLNPFAGAFFDGARRLR
jgi:long-subunit acyl-CoA synthetase (AMP-forming)